MAGKHNFVFLCKGPLMFVTVSRTRQSEAQVGMRPQRRWSYNGDCVCTEQEEEEEGVMEFGMVTVYLFGRDVMS